jgi:hypothetical protein
MRFDVPLTGKKGESIMTPNFNNENLNHLFTGTTLHTVTSISTPETIEGFRQFCSLSVFAASQTIPSGRGFASIMVQSAIAL